MRSMGRVRSRRQEGSWTAKMSVSRRVRVQPRAVRYWAMSAEEMPAGSRVVPRRRWVWATESWMGGRAAVWALVRGQDEVDERAFEAASAGFEDVAADEAVGDGGGGEVGSALEAVAGIGVEEVAAGAGADGGGGEPGGLDEDVAGVGGDHGVVAAHDAGEGEGAGVVGDDEVVGGEGAGGAVEEAELLAGEGAADDDAAVDLVEVEGVGGVAHAEEDEVGDVDGVRDLLLAEGGEEVGDAAFGGGDVDVAEDLGGEAAAEGFGVGVDADGEGVAARGGGEGGVERVQGEVVDGGDLAGDAVMVHGVDAVGGDVHVEERACGVAGGVVELEDAFDSDAAEGEVFGELGVIDVEDGQVGAEPFGEDLHGWARFKCTRPAGLGECSDGSRARSGMMRFMNLSNSGTVKAVSP